jgi:hypothetical protein
MGSVECRIHSAAARENYKIVVRATEKTGKVQTAEVRLSFPDVNIRYHIIIPVPRIPILYVTFMKSLRTSSIVKHGLLSSSLVQVSFCNRECRCVSFCESYWLVTYIYNGKVSYSIWIVCSGAKVKMGIRRLQSPTLRLILTDLFVKNKNRCYSKT